MELNFDILKQPHFSEPEGWQWQSFKSSAGYNMRYGSVLPKDKPATKIIVCLPGLSEFGEKYFETAHDMLSRGYGFFIMDWLGQGGSHRLHEKYHQRIHSNGFEQHLNDLNRFLSQHVAPRIGGTPIVFLGHSMGGHLGLRYLHDYPGCAEKAAFTAPMIKIAQTEKFSMQMVNALSNIFKLGGGAYAPGASDWPNRARLQKPGYSIYSSDPQRDQLQNLWFDNNSDLRVGGPTYRWLHEAFRSCFLLSNPEYLRTIQTPLLIAVAGQDKVVSSSATCQALKDLPHGKCLMLPDARHEILMERDEIRNQFLAAFDEFIYNSNSP